MNATFRELRTAVMSTVMLAVVCGGLYPLAVLVIGQGLFREKARGSLIVDAQGAVRGSTLIGQAFTARTFFHPRPSAAGTGYDATSSGGSNLGPTSRKLADAIRDRVATYRAANGLAADAPVPADAVTASASGLDPHITPNNAALQAPRVAEARRLPLPRVTSLIAQATEPPQCQVFGETRVNVLRLNAALDALPEVSTGP